MGFAQAPPPPPPTPPVGTGAPLDNEVAFLLLATTLFGVWKLQKVKTAEKF